MYDYYGALYLVRSISAVFLYFIAKKFKGAKKDLEGAKPLFTPQMYLCCLVLVNEAANMYTHLAIQVHTSG